MKYKAWYLWSKNSISVNNLVWQMVAQHMIKNYLESVTHKQMSDLEFYSSFLTENIFVSIAISIVPPVFVNFYFIIFIFVLCDLPVFFKPVPVEAKLDGYMCTIFRTVRIVWLLFVPVLTHTKNSIRFLPGHKSFAKDDGVTNLMGQFTWNPSLSFLPDVAHLGNWMLSTYCMTIRLSKIFWKCCQLLYGH